MNRWRWRSVLRVRGKISSSSCLATRWAENPNSTSAGRSPLGPSGRSDALWRAFLMPDDRRKITRLLKPLVPEKRWWVRGKVSPLIPTPHPDRPAHPSPPSPRPVVRGPSVSYRSRAGFISKLIRSPVSGRGFDPFPPAGQMTSVRIGTEFLRASRTH